MLESAFVIAYLAWILIAFIAMLFWSLDRVVGLVLAVSLFIVLPAACYVYGSRNHQLLLWRQEEAQRYEELEARFAKRAAKEAEIEAARNSPIEAKPLEKNLALRREQVRVWLAETNGHLGSTFYKALKDQPVPTIELDHGMRIRYFANGIYVVCHPDKPRGEDLENYRTGITAANLRSAPSYQGHYVLFKDLDGKTQLKHGGGKKLSMVRTKQLTELYGYPDLDAYRRYKEKMRPEMERHKEKRELEQLQHFQRLAEEAYQD